MHGKEEILRVLLSVVHFNRARCVGRSGALQSDLLRSSLEKLVQRDTSSVESAGGVSCGLQGMTTLTMTWNSSTKFKLVTSRGSLSP